MNGTHALRRAAAGAALLALIAAGCGSSGHTKASPSTTAGGGGGGTPAGSGGSGATPGLTATTITVGQLADVSGPVPGVFQGAANGMDAWAAYVNSIGGIAGRKVVVDHKDSGVNCTLYTNGFKALSASAFADVGTFSIVDACGEPTLKADPGFPDLHGAVLDPAIAAFPSVYGASPATSGYPTTGFQWVKDTYGASVVTHTAGIYPAATIANFNEQKTAATSIGYDYVYSREFGNTETNYTSDILRMKAEGIEVVDLFDLPVTDLADFLQQAAQQGFHPKAVLSSTGYDATFFKLLGNPALAAPWVAPVPYSMYLGEDAAAVPEIGILTNWLHKTHPGYPMNLYVMEGFAAGLLFQQAMAGMGKHPTRAGLLSAVGKITNFTADGLISPANVGQKKGQVCEVMIRAVNGKFVRAAPSQGFECEGAFVYAKP